MEGVDVSMMGVALPSIRAELGLSTSSLQWIVSAYVLGYGGFVLLGGRAADLLGRRGCSSRGWPCSSCSRGSAGSPTAAGCSIVARFVTGVAAGFMAPAGLSIITSSFPEGRERNQALLVYAGVGAAGFSLGMVRRRAADRDRVALGVLRARADGGALLVWRSRSGCRATRGACDGTALTSVARSLTGAMILLVFTVVRAPDADARATLRRARRQRRTADGVRPDRAPGGRAARPARDPALGHARAGERRRLPVHRRVRRRSSSWPCSTCRSCAAGRRSRPGSRCAVLGIDAILAPTLTPRLVERFGKLPVIGRRDGARAVGYGCSSASGADWTYAAMLPTMVLVGVGVRARVRDADDRRHRRDRRGRAGPRERAAVRVAAVRRARSGSPSWRRSTWRRRTARPRRPSSTATGPAARAGRRRAARCAGDRLGARASRGPTGRALVGRMTAHRRRVADGDGHGACGSSDWSRSPVPCC